MGRKRNAKKVNGTMTPSVPPANEDDKLAFTCETSPIFGRFLKTKDEIKKGGLILSEKFLVAGPNRGSRICCLGCHVDLADKKNRLKCTSCSWPVCTEKCGKSSIFHPRECRFFAEHKIQISCVWHCMDVNDPLIHSFLKKMYFFKPPENLLENDFDFGAITILRGLILKMSDSSAWEALLRLEHHNGIRSLLPLWKENEDSVVKPLREILGLDKFFDENEVHSICGILEVNAFELGELNISYRGVFPTAAMMAHDCIANATHFEDSSSGTIEVRAAVDIPPGTPITVCYAYVLEGTVKRRKMLLETKFFECICNRCQDESESETNMSTILCASSCRIGHVHPVMSNDKVKNWQCSSCHTTMESSEVEQLLDKYSTKAENTVGIRSSENFLLECSKYFHQNHYIPFGIKFNLCQTYGREKTVLQDLSQVELERKLCLCSQVLQVLNILTPGHTITRGLVLYELQATEITLARRIFETRRFSKAILKRKLECALKILTESIDILSLSHPSTAEYKVAVSAKIETLPELKNWINILKK